MTKQAKMRIGEGEFQYEVVDQWGQLPAGKAFGTTHGVVEDAQGRIIVHHTGEESIYIFDKDGQFLDSWGSEYSPGAHGMTYVQEADGEYLYLAVTGQHMVVKTTLDGREVLRIVTPDLPEIYNEEKKFVPTETVVAANGDIYIADGYGQPWIHCYDKQGKYIKSFGGAGDADGQLSNVHGITIDLRSGEERILVADRGHNRLQYFTMDGQYISQVKGMLRCPCTAKVVGDLMYIPDLHSRVTILSKQDEVAAHLGDWDKAWEIQGWPNLPKSDWQVGKFSSPHDLHVDGEGNIYVAEWLSNGTGKMTKLCLVK
ncbi:MAG: hypothetical protein JKX85_07660 [Phycisphaeraceae bacterium]|nr:hypothetical protein [Phycisphaeraceae bacterium]